MNDFYVYKIVFLTQVLTDCPNGSSRVIIEIKTRTINSTGPLENIENYP